MKTSRILIGLLIFLLTILAASSCKKTEKIELKMKLNKGDSYKIKWTADQNISQTFMGKKVDINQKIVLGYIFDVVDVDKDGAVTFKITYGSVYFKQGAPMGEVEYDSKKKSKEVHPVARGFATLVGQNFSTKMSPDGRVKSFQGVDEMLKNMVKGIDDLDKPNKAAVEKNLKEKFGEEALKEMMESMMAIYPEKPVGVGDSWSRKIVISKGYPMIIDNIWKLKERKGGIAFIDIHSILKPNPKASIDGPTFDLTGEQKGSVEMEETSGFTMRSKITQKISGTIKIKGTPQIPAGMSWPISIDSIISMEPLKE